MRTVKILIIFLATFSIVGSGLGFFIALLRDMIGFSMPKPWIIGILGGLLGGWYGPKFNRYLQKKIN